MNVLTARALLLRVLVLAAGAAVSALVAATPASAAGTMRAGTAAMVSGPQPARSTGGAFYGQNTAQSPPLSAVHRRPTAVSRAWPGVVRGPSKTGKWLIGAGVLIMGTATFLGVAERQNLRRRRR